MTSFEKIRIVAARDFWAIVQTKSFLIGLIGFFFIGSVMPVMVLLSQLPTVCQIGVIDRTGNTYPRLEAKLKAEHVYGLAAISNADKGNQKLITTALPVTASVADDMAQALASLEAKKLNIVIEIVPHPGAEPTFTTTYASLADRVPGQILKGAFQEIIREDRAAHLGITPEQVRAFDAPIEVKNQKRQSGTTTKVNDFDFHLAYLLPVMMIFGLFGLINFQAERLLTALMEEKLKRLLEVLLTRMTITELILGKMLGVLGVGFLLYTGVSCLMWMGVSLIGLTGWITLKSFFWFTLFYVTGYFLYGMLYASVGAACASPKDAENMAMPLRMLLMVPIMASVYVTTHPESPASLFCSFLPMTAPFVMTNRLALLDISLWQPFLAVCSIIVAGLIGLWIATRIFRASVLAQSRSLTMAEIWRSLKGE